VNTKLKLKITLDFRGELFRHAQRLSLSFHDKTYSGKIVYLLNNQSNAVAGLILTIPSLAQAVLTFIGMFVVMVVIDELLAFTSLVVIPFLMYSVKSYALRIHKPLHKVKDMESQTLSMIQEAMSMLRVMVSFGREKYEWQRFRNQGEQALDARVKVTVRQAVFELIVNLINAAGFTLVIGLGATHILQGRLTIGELLVIMAYISSIYQSLGSISTSVGALQDQVVSLERVFELLDTEPDVTENEDAIELSEAPGKIVFDNVQFSYGEHSETLKDLTFRIEPAEFVAIVGMTGAGKTTLVSLLPRFYDPGAGRILIDGVDIRKYSLSSLRKRISVVTQDPVLFVGSIRENIQYGRLEASDEEIIHAAKAANAHEFIMRLPDQYDSTVGERGAGLSGGERQRISIARAFLKNAPILIMDEPTAFIDPKTEANIFETLDQLRKGRTTIMISHRVAKVRHADKIVVMSDGQIVGMGTHEELIANDGLFRQFNSILKEPADA
jgi:ABC-type multidrug transport system fused ATPase/permease subunit